MSNSTLPPLPEYTLRPQPSLLPFISDAYLTLALPIIAYWILSLFFHFIDECDFFPQYRLHTPAEVLKRNHATRWEVFRDVILQQVIQTVVGAALTVFDPEPMVGKEDYDVAVWAQRVRMAQRVIPGLVVMLGFDAGQMSRDMALSHPILAGLLSGGQYDLFQSTEKGTVPAFASWEIMAAKMLYHFAIPALQFIVGVVVIDTWQYFWHRAMHLNKWLYTTFHSRHHRLYVPYAYGALYNHPFEGFLLDTLGAGIAYLVTGMTVRQSMWFFTCSTIKTVDDHCGYALPFDPIQHLTSNNAGYHDVHHQSWGIKTNFSQPFFTFWDRLLGTMWTGGDVSARYERARLAAQRKVDADNTDPASSGDRNAASPAGTPLARTRKSRSSSTTSYFTPDVKISPPDLQSSASEGMIAEAAETTTSTAESVRDENQNQNQAQVLRRSPRKKAMSTSGFASPMKELRSRVNTSLHGKGSGVLGVEQ